MSQKRHEFRWYRARPVQFVLYLVVRVVIMVIVMFPYRFTPVLGGILGRVIRFIDRKHARIAAKNLERSGDVCPPGEIPAFIDRVYRHIGLSFVETLMIPRLMERHEISGYVKLKGFQLIDRLVKEGRGVIAAIGHLGNWELAALSVCLAGYPLNSLARPIENPWLDRYVMRYRQQTGQRIIPKYRALGEMIRVLQRNGLLIIQVDQDARHSGVYVRFFGRPASTHRSAAVLSLKYGTPIVVTDIYREGGMHHVEVTESIHPDDYRDAEDPVKALTQAYTRKLEEAIRKHPEQWFWVHDRWKTAERVARVDAAAVT